MSYDRYSDRLRPVSALIIGRSTFWLHGTPETLAPLLAAHKITYDELVPSPLNPDNGILAVMKVGQLIDRLAATDRL